MQTGSKIYDVAVIGGGLAGLSLSIQLAREGYSVVVFEKEAYPFHKVCGEYISMESWDFLQRIGLPLNDMHLPIIERLQLTAPNGKAFTTSLPLGGFGLSRFTIDHLLAQLAIQSGVTLLENARADDVVHNASGFLVHFTTAAGAQTANARVCCGAFGKRSNLDVRWKRDFITCKQPSQNNFIAVKYHVQTQWPANTIGLHNFKSGYCGISKIEDGKYCLCYLTTAINLKNNHSIDGLQQNILGENPALKEIFENSTVLQGFPVTIAQISFAKKTQSQNGILMLGDAGGMIAPLCGNGMSMALHSSKIATGWIKQYLRAEINYAQLEKNYKHQWRKAFGSRLAAGRLLHPFFGNNRLSNLFVNTFCALPFLAHSIIKKTHGQPF